MFSYSDLTTTLTVVNEVSPSILNDYYTKNEVDNLFVKEVDTEDSTALFLRSKGQWVQQENGDEFLYVGFSSTSNYEELDLTKLNKIVIGSSDSYNTVIENKGNNYLWIISPYLINKTTLNPYDIEIPMTPAIENYYISAELKPAIYDLTIKIEK